MINPVERESRTADIQLGRLALYQLSYSRSPRCHVILSLDEESIGWQSQILRFAQNDKTLVGAAGFEPATSCAQGRRAIQTALRPVRHSIPKVQPDSQYY